MNTRMKMGSTAPGMYSSNRTITRLQPNAVTLLRPLLNEARGRADEAGKGAPTDSENGCTAVARSELQQ